MDQVKVIDALAAARRAEVVKDVADRISDRAVRIGLAAGLSARQIEQETGISKSRVDRIRRSPMPTPVINASDRLVATQAADVIWAHVGGAPSGDLSEVATVKPARRHVPRAGLAAMLSLVLLSTILGWQLLTVQDKAGTAAQVAAQNASVVAAQTTAREVAVRYVTSYLLGASAATCQMERLTVEELARCERWQGEGHASTLGSPPVADAVYSYRDGWAVTVHFNLDGEGDTLARTAVYVVQGKVDHSAAIGIQNSPASRADYEHTVWRLDETQPIVYPSQ